IGAFKQLTNFAVLGVLTGAGYITVAARLGLEAAEQVANDIEMFVSRQRDASAKEQLAITTAKNTLEDLSKGESSWLKYAPPEVKGRLLDIICFDFGPTIWDFYTVGPNSRERAILALLEISQCWRDYEETVTRMNQTGEQRASSLNRERQRTLTRCPPVQCIALAEQRLAVTSAVPNQLVHLARYISFSGAYYA